MPLVCAVNLSEGRPVAALDRIVASGGVDVLDVHRDPFHHRSVLTVVGDAAVRSVAAAAVGELDLRRHSGVHPRLGVVDVVPFVPYHPSPMAEAEDARDHFVAWIGTELGVPAFVYGESGPALPQIRRQAFVTQWPVAGTRLPHPTAGAVAVAARAPLVAYNLWLAEPDLELATWVAATIRSASIRALGLPVGDRVQVSMNLVDPLRVGPAQAYDAVAAVAPVAGAELVGLVPRAVLEATPPNRWAELDLDANRSVEARLAARSG